MKEPTQRPVVLASEAIKLLSNPVLRKLFGRRPAQGVRNIRPRPRGAGRPRARRASSASRTSGADPGNGADEPEARVRLRLTAPRRATLTYGCLSAEHRGAEVAP
jgi:hypothetical protein